MMYCIGSKAPYNKIMSGMKESNMTIATKAELEPTSMLFQGECANH